jgi:hypothetical protein
MHRNRLTTLLAVTFLVLGALAAAAAAGGSGLAVAKASTAPLQDLAAA